MEYENSPSENVTTTDSRPVMPAIINGAKGKCPNCGNSTLFDSRLKVKDQCDSCGEEFHHHRADDLPAYLNIFIVGHIVVAATMVIMDAKIIGLWPLVTLSALSAVIFAVLLMRPLKGIVVGAQWATRMHGFGGHED
ncbi:MAG: DUF983 domain-containing protein [Pseudomonadota bacterium]